MDVAHWETENLDEHIALIKRQVDRSLQDAETRQLALKIVSGRVDYVRDPGTGADVPVVTAWRQHFRVGKDAACAPRNDACEIDAIWNFWVTNVRYTLDPDDIDTFATLRYTLEAGGGDCDDSCVGLAALLKAIGFKVSARVISTDGKYWEHIYLLVGCPKENPTKWLPLDPTVEGATPGWEYEQAKSRRDFQF